MLGIFLQSSWMTVSYVVIGWLTAWGMYGDSSVFYLLLEKILKFHSGARTANQRLATGLDCSLMVLEVVQMGIIWTVSVLQIHRL